MRILISGALTAKVLGTEESLDRNIIISADDDIDYKGIRWDNVDYTFYRNDTEDYKLYHISLHKRVNNLNFIKQIRESIKSKFNCYWNSYINDEGFKCYRSDFGTPLLPIAYDPRTTPEINIEVNA